MDQRFEIVCMARTAMGKRCIRERLLTPTMNVDVLQERYDLIAKIEYDEGAYQQANVYLQRYEALLKPTASSARLRVQLTKKLAKSATKQLPPLRV